MGAEHLLHRGNPAIPVVAFTVLAVGNCIFSLAHGGFPDTGIKEALGWPVGEELMYRLLPLTAARLLGNGPLATTAFALASSAAFAGEHWFDTTGHFHPEYVGTREAETFGMGLLLFGIGRVGGVSNSIAVHAGLNSGIALAGLLR